MFAAEKCDEHEPWKKNNESKETRRFFEFKNLENEVKKTLKNEEHASVKMSDWALRMVWTPKGV